MWSASPFYVLLLYPQAIHPSRRRAVDAVGLSGISKEMKRSMLCWFGLAMVLPSPFSRAGAPSDYFAPPETMYSFADFWIVRPMDLAVLPITATTWLISLPVTAASGTSEQAYDLLTPEAVTTGLLVLCAEEAPNRLILTAGAGGFACTHINETRGIHLTSEQRSPENVLASLAAITDRAGEEEYTNGGQQGLKFVGDAMQALGSKQ